MKLKLLLSCALVLALALTVAAVPASAATFPDIQTHWARSYIEDMTLKGMFKGYDDGTFKPENKLTTAEALALCARTVGLSESVATQIAVDRREDVDNILRGSQSWFYREFAICLETGILSYADLKNLSTSGALTKSIAKEDLSGYLVRAMQLGPMAERLSTYNLNFSDASSIRSSLQPYVYLLYNYGIVQGDQYNAFGPKGEVTRAVMATMLSRSLEFMREKGIEADLPDYTDYDFQQGTIASVTTGENGVVLLTLNNDLTGVAFNVSLPGSVVIYENNMLTTSSALKAGKHVRVGLNSRGTAYLVRISEALESHTATVNGIDGDSIAVTTGGMGDIVVMDRFTQVQVGNKTVGDRSIVDPNAGYTTAVYKLDDQNRLVSIQFTGGTRSESGIIASAEKVIGTSNITLRVIGFDGVTHQYTVPSGAAITVNGLVGTLSNSYVGNYVTVKLSDGETSIVAVAVDSVTKYVQGAIRNSTWQNSTNTISIVDMESGKSTSYPVADGAIITYEDETIALRDIKKEWFVTGRLSGGELIQVDCYPGSVITEGTLTNRTFSTLNTTMAILEVTKDDDTVVTFTVDLVDPPTIYRNDERSSIDKLRMGDAVEITVRYSEVTRIESTPQTANMTATINRIIQEVGGSTLELTLADGTVVNYKVTTNTTITQNDKAMPLSYLSPGDRIAMVVNGDQISAIQIQQSSNSDDQLNGTVIYVDTAEKTILVRTLDEAGNENLVTVNVPASTSLLEWDGAVIYLRQIEVGDVIQVNGAYDGAEFSAKLILRK